MYKNIILQNKNNPETTGSYFRKQVLSSERKCSPIGKKMKKFQKSEYLKYALIFPVSRVI